MFSAGFVQDILVYNPSIKLVAFWTCSVRATEKSRS